MRNKNFRSKKLNGFQTSPQGLRKYAGLGSIVAGGIILTQKDAPKIVAGILIVGGGFLYFMPEQK